MQWLLQPIQQNSNPGKGLKSLHFHSLILIRFQKIPVKIFLDAKIVQAIHITKKKHVFSRKKTETGKTGKGTGEGAATQAGPEHQCAGKHLYD